MKHATDAQTKDIDETRVSWADFQQAVDTSVPGCM